MKLVVAVLLLACISIECNAMRLCHKQTVEKAKATTAQQARSN